MDIVIDIGNSAIKIGQVDSAGGITNVIRCSATDFDPENDFDIPAGSIITLGRSGTHENLVAILDWLKQKNVTIRLLEKTAILPFTSRYTPGQAGIDRLANVAAAIALYPGAAIIVDAGSAITLEVISSNHIFLGGAILPGIRLQSQSLNTNTADLPGISQIATPPPPIATDTATAIRSGITHGIAGALHHFINLVATQLNNPDTQLILTGGDAQILAELLPGKQFTVIPELTLSGLYLLATYQENQ